MTAIVVHTAEGFVTILVAWLVVTELVQYWSIPIDILVFVIRGALLLYILNTKMVIVRS